MFQIFFSLFFAYFLKVFLANYGMFKWVVLLDWELIFKFHNPFFGSKLQFHILIEELLLVLCSSVVKFNILKGDDQHYRRDNYGNYTNSLL